MTAFMILKVGFCWFQRSGRVTGLVIADAPKLVGRIRLFLTQSPSARALVDFRPLFKNRAGVTKSVLLLKGSAGRTVKNQAIGYQGPNAETTGNDRQRAPPAGVGRGGRWRVRSRLDSGGKTGACLVIAYRRRGSHGSPARWLA